MQSGAPTFSLSAAAWTSIANHASAQFPEECCGALIGLSSPGSFTVHSAHPCRNRAPHSRQARFLIDPEDILDARRLAREASLDLVGFYHSHPGKPAYFSARDLRECWPGYPNLVVSVPAAGPPSAKAFLADSARSRAAELILVIEPGFTPSSEAPPR